MARALPYVLVVAVLVPVLPARAQEAPARGPIVAVVEAGTLRVNGERLRRALGTALEREVVRITEVRARDATGTLTIAYEGSRRWLLRFESHGAAAEAWERVPRSGTLETVLGAAAARLVAEVESAPEVVAEAPTPSPLAPWGTLYLAWGNELMDPFPHPPRRELAIWSEILDPFTTLATTPAAFMEVLDPWGH